jgi:hypothetical protein
LRVVELLFIDYDIKSSLGDGAKEVGANEVLYG